jgi:hypothetical protein
MGHGGANCRIFGSSALRCDKIGCGDIRHDQARLVHEGGYGLAMPVGGEPVFTAPRTGVPCWCGERMDDGMAVEGLIRRE